MKRNIIHIIMVLILISFTGCDDFLTIPPKSNSGTTGNFYKNETDIEYALTGIYAKLQAGGYYQNSMVLLNDVRSDDFSGFANTGGNAGREYHLKIFTASSDNQIFLNVWLAAYETIYRCNVLLSHIDIIENETIKNQYEAETRFIRGLSYFNLVRLYGAVPLILEPISPEEAARCIRNSVEDVYAAIETDLKFAADPGNLPISFKGNDLGRVTSLAAQGMLGKVYLTRERWQDAVTTLGALISTNNNGTHYLMEDIANTFSGAPPMDSSDDEFSNYPDYQPTKMNPEILFAVLYAKDVSGEGRGANTYYTNPGDLNEELKHTSPSCIYAPTDRRRDLMRSMNGSTSSNNLYIKYADRESSFGTYEYPVVVLRWSDILLMYAEALNEVGYSNAPFEYLNRVRTRSYPEGAYSTTDLPSQEAFRKAVWHERRLEFPMEMQRWFDLVRTGEAIEAIGKINLTITSNDLLCPIPYSEYILRGDPSAFPQNPGY